MCNRHRHEPQEKEPFFVVAAIGFLATMVLVFSLKAIVWPSEPVKTQKVCGMIGTIKVCNDIHTGPNH